MNIYTQIDAKSYTIMELRKFVFIIEYLFIRKRNKF